MNLNAMRLGFVLAIALLIAACSARGSELTPQQGGQTGQQAGQAAAQASSVSEATDPGESEASPPAGGGGRGPWNWENPISGELVESLAAAQSRLAFESRTPQGLGTAVKILVSPPDESLSSKSRGVAFLFDTSEYGRVVVVEGRDDVSVREFEAATKEMVAQNGDPNVHGRVDIVVIKGQIQARLSTGAQGELTLRWREGNLVFILSGPELTRPDLVAIAEKI